MDRLKKKILITDDDPVFRDIAATAFRENGFEPLQAGDGAEALSTLKVEPVALLVLDLDMPVMDGFKVIEAVRGNSRTRFLPIIVVTGRDGVEDIKRAYQLGATSFTVKPVDWALLLYHVQFVLRANDMEQDVREAKRAIESISKYQTDLLSVISHEFRTPIHAINGYADLVQTALGNPLLEASVRDYLVELTAAASRLDNNVEDVLFLSNSIAHRAQFRADDFAFAPMLAKVVETWTEVASKKSINLEVKLDLPEGLDLYCDQVLFCKALGKLLDNAVNYSPYETTISLYAGLNPKGNLECRVTDNGPGMAPQQIQQVEKAFTQGDMSLSRPCEGLGLGLSICKAIVDGHDGKMKITSRVEEGTTVSIIIPSSRLTVRKSSNQAEETGDDTAVA